MGMGIAGLMTGAGAAQGLETLLKQRLLEREMALQEQAQRASEQQHAEQMGLQRRGQDLTAAISLDNLDRLNRNDIMRQGDRWVSDQAIGDEFDSEDPNVQIAKAAGYGGLFKAKPMMPVPDAVANEQTGQEPAIRGLKMGTPDQMGARPISGDYAPVKETYLGTGSQRNQMDSARRAEEAGARAEKSLEMQEQRLEAALSKAGGAGGVQLTPEALDMAAMVYAKTGQLVSLGMGAANDRKLILNRAAALFPGTDVAGAGAEYKSNLSSLTQLTKRIGAIKPFAAQASLSLDNVLKSSAEVPRTGSPLVNRYKNWVSKNLAGQAPLSKFEVFAYNAARDYARVSAGGAESVAQMTDAAVEAADALLNTALNPEQLAEVVSAMKADMANTTSTLEQQLADTKAQISRKPGETQQPSPGGDTVPAEVEAILKSKGAGRYKLSDGTTWIKGQDGSIKAVK